MTLSTEPEVMDHNNEYVFFGHLASAGAILSALSGALPTIITLLASIAALTWYCITIYESPFVQRWLHGLREKKIKVLRDKLARLEAGHLAKR